jgi:hypothetical protein
MEDYTRLDTVLPGETAWRTTLGWIQADGDYKRLDVARLAEIRKH